MRIAKKIWCFTLSLLFALHVSGQDPVLNTLQNQFNTYRENVLQEKIFLHSDKDFYVTGEICWFKIYLVDAVYNKPLDLSKIAYVEVLDQQHKPVLQAKIAMKKGTGNGSLELPLSMLSGNYILRAYTSWMKNFGAAYFFEKKLTVINTLKSIEPDSIPLKIEYALRFFPEGGNLVAGIQSKVGFQLVDQSGSGSRFNGVIVDNGKDTLLNFAPLKFGIGNFVFTPKTGHRYSANIILPDGHQLSQDLPATYNEGWVMRLETPANNQVKVTVQASASLPTSSVYLFAHTKGVIKLALSSGLQSGQAVFFIDKSKLGDGVSHITIFNGERKPVCERLYFKYPEKMLHLGIESKELQYQTRQNVNLKVSSANSNDRPLVANMSMAVYRLDSLQGISAVDISNYLWMGADLPAGIESPDDYFRNNGEGAEEATDNLMLTNGWRRFRWEDILSNSKPLFEYYPEYAGHVVTGRVTEQATGRPAKDINYYLSVTGSQKQFRPAISDAAGHVKFEMGEFYNDGELIVQPNSRIDSVYAIEIFKPYSEKYSSSKVPEFSFSQKNALTLSTWHSNSRIQATYNRNKQLAFSSPMADTSSFYYKPDITYLLDNFVRFTTMEEVLREYVAPVNVRRKDGEFHLHVVDKHRNVYFEADPLVLLDGVPIFDMDKFMQYDPLKVRQLDVVSAGYYLGSQSYPGIVNFITYSNNLQDYELDPHATVLDYDGLQLQREFYSPEYSNPQQLASRLPDYRNLLYWNPNINTSAAGQQAVSFFSGDLTGKFVVVLQGLSKDGQTGVASKIIEVKPRPAEK